MRKITLISLLLLLSLLTFVSTADTKRIASALVAVADLSVTMGDTPDPVNTGATLTYTITVNNNGPDAAASASWTDTLPAGTTFQSLSSVGGWSCSQPDPGDSGTVSCSNPSFAVGSAVFTLAVNVNTSVPALSTLTNSATATSSTPDSNTGNETGSATTTVHSPSNVAGSKSASGSFAANSTLTYLISFGNSSNSDQQDNPGNEVTDVLASDLTLISADSSAGTATANLGTNTVTWNGRIPAGESVSLTITATINSGTTGNTINNHGTFSYDADGNGTNETNSNSNTYSFVVGPPTVNADLSVSKLASADTIAADSDLTYTITVTNGGPDTATAATLTDTLPGDMTFVSLSQPAGWSCNSLTPGLGGTLTCSRDLPAGSGAQVFTLVGHIPSGTADGTFYLNMASVTTTATDSTSENNSSSAGTIVGCLTNPVVTTSADSGAGSLRRAIQDACVGGIITFDMTQVTSPITLTSAELLVNKDLTIQGPGASQLTVSGNNSVRVFNIQSGNAVTISDLTIANGRVNGAINGGGVLNSGALTLINCYLYGSSTASRGGGIYSDGPSLTLNNCNVGGAGSGQANNAIFSGAGIFNNSGTLTVTAGSFVGNSAGAQGGGAIQVAGGTATINGVTISQNNAFISSGGGIGSTGGTTNIINSLISNNTASTGGALWNNGGTITVVNSTASGNTVTGSGGGVRSDSGTLTLTNVTLTNNRSDSDNSGTEPGGGIFRAGGTVTLKNAIVAGNFRGTGSTADDISGTVDAASSFNLIGTGGSGGLTNTNGNQVGVANFLLGVLANNGGPTQTHLLLPGSPAINAGSNALLPADTYDLNGNSNTAEPLPVDQRGFPRIVNTTVDMGAVEVNYAITATAGTPQSTSVNSAFATSLKATVTESGTAKSGISVTFTAPGSGASGTFPGPSATAVVATDANGVATAPTFTANATGGTYNVVASIGTGQPTATFVLTNNKLNQTISFGALANKTFGDPDFTVSATASSGLTVTFAASGNCTISTNTVHLTGAGSCTITASQAGNDTYNAATPVAQTFNIAKAASSTAVTSSVNPSNVGQSVTFTATVTSTGGTPTGTVQFKDGGTNLGPPQPLSSGVATFSTTALTAGVHTITADYSGDANFLASTGTLPGGQQVGSIIRFSSDNYNTTEGSGFTTITVQRIGDLSQAVTVDYATPDDSSSMTILPCSTPNGVGSPRCDFTTALGTLRFAAGDGASRTFAVLVNQDSFVEGPETLPLTLSNLTGGAAFSTPGATTSTATLSIADDVIESAGNPIDDTETFVRQQYHDFLNRDADPAGLAFWIDNINKCNDPARRPAGLTVAQCIETFRVHTSAAFYLSIEFQQSGYFIHRMFKAGFDDIAPPTVPVPIRYSQFIRDAAEVNRGVIVGQGNWEAQLNQNKQAFALAFVQRQEFLLRYPANTSATAFVNSLDANAGSVLTSSERSALISELSPNPADPALRASVLKKVADNAVMVQQHFNRAFVLMQYFGYLRRNPDAAPEPNLDFAGYNFWLNKLNSFNGDFIKAEMVKGFINSIEYRQRFGP